MASGIVRASDRVAIWHSAADEPSTSEPPQGVDANKAGQDVTGKPSIPNSNKFKTPANGLKKLLDTIDNGTDDKSYYGPNAHPKLQDWLTNHPDFTKTYFKPGYQDALKAHLGVENYDKLNFHAPKEHVTALTTHKQQPAPNSNKFKTPINGLNKVLHAPGASSEHIKTWLGAHPDFAKGYLHNPEYQDAVKGALGKNAYDMLQEHLKGPTPTPGEKVKENAEQSFAPTFKPQTQEQALAPEEDDWEQQLLPQSKPEQPEGFLPPQTQPATKTKNPFLELLKNQPPSGGQVTENGDGEPINSPHYDAMQDHAAKGHYSAPMNAAIQSPGFHGWFHSHSKDQQAELESKPGQAVVKFQKWLVKHPQAPEAPQLSPEDQGEAEAVKKLIPKIEVATPPKGESGVLPPEQQFGTPESKGVGPQHPALLGDIKKIFPDSDMQGKTDDEMKAQLEQWLKYLPDHPDFKTHVPQLQAVYDKWFGGKPSTGLDYVKPVGPSAKPLHQQLNEAYKAAFPKSSPAWSADNTPEGMKDHLQKLIKGTHNEVVNQKLQSVYDQVFGHSDLIGGGDPWNSDAEGMKPVKFEDLDGPDPFGQTPSSSQSVPGFDDQGSSSFKDYLHNIGIETGPASDPEVLKGLYDGYSGGGAKKSPDVGTGVAAASNTPKDMLAPDGTYSQLAIDYMKQGGWPVPGETSHHKSWSPGSWGVVQSEKGSSNPSASYLPWEEFKKQHGGEAPAVPTTSTPADADLKKLLGDGDITSTQYDILKGKSEDWWGNQWKTVNSKSSDLWQKLLAIKPGASFDSKALAEEVGKLTGIGPGVTSGGLAYSKMTPEQAKAKLKKAIDSDGYGVGVEGYQALYDKYFGSGASTPAAPPAFDPKGFASEFKNLFPNSNWATEGDKTPEEAEAKLKGMVQTADENYPDTDKTQQAHVLYDKYFGGGVPSASKTTPVAAPTGGSEKYPPPEWIKKHFPSLDWTPEKIKQSFDENPEGNITEAWGQDHYGDKTEHMAPAQAPEPEEEELENPNEVSTPFKTEESKPEDIAKWAGAKPKDALQWKQFAQWWGNTKIPPDQEALLYNTWFPGKQAAPDFANKWFQQVFEHHSTPSGGDLGLKQAPSWAHSTWAFGDKAEKDWPMFAQWAAKDPGIPKGMSVKQKLAIWKGLSVGDKKEIQENYNPSNPVDAPSVVGALSQAYPDSDWTKWSTMPQGTLKNNVEMLAKSGYPKAIPVYNQYFGGNLPVPEEKVETEEEPTPEPMKTIPVSKLPEWVTSYWGSNEDSAKKYTQLKKFADAIGQGDEAEKGTGSWNSAPNGLIKQWNLVPDHLKDALSTAPTMPFHSPDEFVAWLDTQPKPKDDIAKIYPDDYNVSNVSYWGSHPVGYPKNYQKSAIEGYLNSETDPLKKNQLLDAYYKYFGGNKPTLGQALKDIYPDQDWDKTLKTSDKETVTKLLKKQLKAETNPEKWIALVDTWGKYINGNSGIKQVTNALKGQQTGNPVDASTLKELYYWKTQLGASPSAAKPDYWTVNQYDHNSAYIKDHSSKSGDSAVLPYFGWTPPGHKGGGYVADPAQLATFGPTYTAPPEEKKGKQYQELLDTLAKKKVGFSKADQEVAKSSEFANWFQAAPTAYRSVFQSNPGIAIDDFKAFMTSGDIGGMDQVPEGGDGKSKTYDPSAYWAQPYTKGQDSSTIYFGPNNPVKVNPNLFPAPEGSYGDPGHWPGFTKNPKSKDKARPNTPWDVVEDDPGQFPIPLPPGEKWEPKHQNEVLHRGVKLSLSVSVPDAPHASYKTSDPKYYARMMAQREKALKMKDLADDIRHSIKGSSDTTLGDLFNTAPSDAPEVPPPPGVWNKNYGPNNAEQSMAFMKWVKDNNVGAEQLYGMAKKWGVSNPHEYGLPGLKEMPGTGFATPKYVHIDGLPDAPAEQNNADPELARKILDLMEMKGKYDTPGLGDHWSRKFQVSDKNFTQEYAADDLLPVIISADWSGLGEHPGRPDSAWGYENEHEINLTPGAPVQVHRVQVRLPGQGNKLFDLPVERHMRYASMKPMAPLNKLADLEEAIEVLASVPDPIRTMEAQIQRLCDEADRKSEAWLYG